MRSKIFARNVGIGILLYIIFFVLTVGFPGFTGVLFGIADNIIHNHVGYGLLTNEQILQEQFNSESLVSDIYSFIFSFVLAFLLILVGSYVLFTLLQDLYYSLLLSQKKFFYLKKSWLVNLLFFLVIIIPSLVVSAVVYGILFLFALLKLPSIVTSFIVILLYSILVFGIIGLHGLQLMYFHKTHSIKKSFAAYLLFFTKWKKVILASIGATILLFVLMQGGGYIQIMYGNGFFSLLALIIPIALFQAVVVQLYKKELTQKAKTKH